MRSEILVSLIVTGVVVALVSGATFAFFSDTETSTGNTFTAGSIDLKIDFECSTPGCGWTLRDLNGEAFFRECDIKPGDWGEATISWHVYGNNAWGRLRFDVVNYENDCTEPESEVDTTCGSPGNGEGELIDYLLFTVWMDEGSYEGWQCTGGVGSCEADPEEGDNVLNGIEEPIVANESLSNIIDDGGIELPVELQASTTYYLGVEWRVPTDVGNIIQSDSLVGSIIMEVVQSKNNPNPWQ